MRKIRADLVGAVMVGRHLFAAGQDVPDGVEIHESLVEANEDAPKASEANEDAPKAPEAPEANEDAPKAPEANEDDFSDLLGDEEKPKGASKSPGRKPAARKS